MELNRFEDLVRQTIFRLPDRIRRRLENVAFVIEPDQRRAQAHELVIERHHVLLGLYQGVPYGRRGPWYSGVLPDKITLFQSSIEQLAGGDEGRIRRIVADTVRHEIAHYFGLDEAEVRRWEKQRRQRPRP
ncbi:MAG: metallopeptidase family protein [Candidatus Kerfeldbacteria bacterium]|nr:metallopeptidase family protein [Candidatus Kerfeldbacteria bacterium]